MTDASNREGQADAWKGPGPEPLKRYPPDAELTYEEREQVEWEMDELMRLVADHLARRPDSPDWTDAALLDVLTRELRAAPPTEDDLTEQEIVAIRERIRERVSAIRQRRAGFRTIREPAPIRQASIAAPPLVAMEEAAMERCTPHIDPSVAAGAGRELWDGECDQWIELPSDVGAGPFLSMGVSGDSMLPLLHAGDVILVKVGPEVRPRSVIVARQRDDGYVVKRVGRYDAMEVELISENPAYAPTVVRRERGAVIGTVVLRWCTHEDG